MAKISQSIGVSGGSSIVAPTKMPQGGDAIATGVATALNAGMSLFAQHQQKEEAARQNTAMANVHTSFLDNQDEAILQQQEAREIQNQIATFHEDGAVSGDEIKMLAGLESKLEKFDLLSSSQRQLRRNALMRQALNDPANEGLQTNIMQMFGNVDIEPEANAAEAAFSNGMDQKYGVGNWTPADAGKEQGRATYLQNVQQRAATDIRSVSNEISGIAAAVADDITASIGQNVDASGALSQDAQNGYKLAIAQSKAEMNKLYMEAASRNAEHAAPDVLAKAKTEIDSYFSALDKLVTGEGNIVGEMGINKQLTAHNDLQAALIKNNSPFIMKAGVNAFNAGANNGFSGMMDMVTLLQDPNNAPLFESLGVSADTALAHGTEVMQWLLTGEEDVAAAMQKFGNKKLMQTLAANVALPEATTKDQADKAVDAIFTASPEDAVEALIDPKNAAAVRANGSVDLVATKAVRMLDLALDANRVSPEDMQYIFANEDGSVQFRSDVPGFQAKAQEDLSVLNQLLRAYPELDAPSIILSRKEEAKKAILAKGKPVEEGVDTSPMATSYNERAARMQEGAEAVGSALASNTASYAEAMTKHRQEPDVEYPDAPAGDAVEDAPVVETSAFPDSTQAGVAEYNRRSPNNRGDAPEGITGDVGSRVLGDVAPAGGETPVPSAPPAAATSIEADPLTAVAVEGQSEIGKKLFGTLTAVNKEAAALKKFGSVDKTVDALLQGLRGDVTSTKTGKSVGLEGFDDSLYVPIGGESGLTLGTGIDLKHQSEKGLVKKGVPKEIAAKLKPYYGKDDKSLEGQKPLTRSEVEKLDRAMVKHSLMKLRKDMPAYDGFPPAMQLALFTAAHQYGNKFLKYNLRKQAVDDDRRAVLHNLSTWQDKTDGGAGAVIEDKYKIMGEMAHEEMLAEQNYILTLLANAYRGKE